MSKVIRKVVVNHDQGLHCRPSASFVKVANKFESNIFVEKDGEKVNGKSIMALLMLGAGKGSNLNLIADGPDADLALNELELLAKNDFVISS